MVKGLRRVKRKTVSIATSWLTDSILCMLVVTLGHFWFSFYSVVSWWTNSAIFMFITILEHLWFSFIPEFGCFKPLGINCVCDKLIQLVKTVTIANQVVPLFMLSIINFISLLVVTLETVANRVEPIFKHVLNSTIDKIYCIISDFDQLNHNKCLSHSQFTPTVTFLNGTLKMFGSCMEAILLLCE